MILRRRRPAFAGPLVVVGGQCRKVGKSALVVDLIRTFSESRWTAVKITPYVEDGCPVKGAACECGPMEHTFAIHEEEKPTGRGDTARFLAAGAKRSLWVQTKEGRLDDALRQLVKSIGNETCVIVESDAAVKFWLPDLFLMVLDPRRADFKRSARSVAGFADAFVFRSPDLYGLRQRAGPINGKPKFLHPPGYDLPARMQTFVRQHFQRSRHHRSGHGGCLFS